MKKTVQSGEQANLVNVSFEEALGKLEGIVKELEKGDLPLEESLERFAVGVTLTQICLAQLNDADRQIDLIIREEKGELVESPLKLQEDGQC